MNKPWKTTFALMLTVLLLGASFACGEVPVTEPILVSEGGEPLPADEAPAPEIRKLAYNEMLVQSSTLFGGSYCWLTEQEARTYYPTLPLPETLHGCPMEGCKITLYDYQASMNSTPGEIYTVEATPQNIVFIEARYSDGSTVFDIQFYPIENVDPSFRLQAITDEGALMINTVNADETSAYLHRGVYTMSVLEGETNDQARYETEDGFQLRYIHGSKITEENIAEYLADPEITTLFDSLIAFTKK